jgi:hypothetical protein
MIVCGCQEKTFFVIIFHIINLKACLVSDKLLYSTDEDLKAKKINSKALVESCLKLNFVNGVFM